MKSAIKRVERESYPVSLVLCQTVGSGVVEGSVYGRLKETVGAITLRIDIPDCDYPVDKVRDAVIEACQRAVEHYSL